MKLHAVLFTIFTLLAFVSGASANPPIWPRQPKLSAAYESLTIALKQIEKSHTGDSARHLANASANLQAAKVHLDTAKKNKGSASHVAIGQIDLAVVELRAGRLDDATASIAKAMEKVTQAARNGR
jgi:hypothetical protein